MSPLSDVGRGVLCLAARIRDRWHRRPARRPRSAPAGRSPLPTDGHAAGPVTTRTELEGDSDFFSSLLGEEAERRQRRVSGAVLIWDNRETQTVNLEKVEA